MVIKYDAHTSEYWQMVLGQSSLIISNGDIADERKIFWALCCH
jgi:hypothetical protein